MNKKFLGGLLIISVASFLAVGCNNQADVPLPPAVQPPPVQVPGMTPPTMPGMPTAPVATAPVAAPPVVETPVVAPPPQTELYPIEEDEPAAKKVSVGTGVCKLAGPETQGEELLGNYQCVIDTKDFPFGLKPPPFGCRVATAGNGKVKLMPQGQRSGMSMSETKLTGFKLDGKYEFSGQKLSINTCMRTKGPGKYKGSGSGILNGDKKNRVKYTLTMTRQ